GSVAHSDGRPVLHEDFPSSAPPSVMVGGGAAGKNPIAIASGDKLLPAPSLARPLEPGSPTSGGRATRHVPNADTSMDGVLGYVSVFNPAIVPFKRVSAFDAVAPDLSLYTAPSALADLEVGGAPRPGHERFWGSLSVTLNPGADVAIPSVAADMRILSYEVTPRTSLTFSRDGADNYFVRSDEAGTHGEHRLVFLVEADPRTFVATIPPSLRLASLDRARVRPLPPRVGASARRAVA